MTLYIAVGCTLLGMALIVGGLWLAEKREQKNRKQVLGSIKEKLKYAGKTNRFKRKTGGTKDKTQ